MPWQANNPTTKTNETNRAPQTNKTDQKTGGPACPPSPRNLYRLRPRPAQAGGRGCDRREEKEQEEKGKTVNKPALSHVAFRQQLHPRVTKHVTLPCTVCSHREQNTIFIQAVNLLYIANFIRSLKKGDLTKEDSDSQGKCDS